MATAESRAGHKRFDQAATNHAADQAAKGISRTAYGRGDERAKAKSGRERRLLSKGIRPLEAEG
jgi:hypothetical protein